MRNPQLQMLGNGGKMSGQGGATNAHPCPNRGDAFEERPHMADKANILIPAAHSRRRVTAI